MSKSQTAPKKVSKEDKAKEKPKRIAFNKPAYTIEQMLEQLKERGLTIADSDKAETILKYISYYRLFGYGLLYEKFDEEGLRLHQYKEGTTFEAILRRYDFDRHLRLLVDDAVERIEVGIRSLICQTLSLKYKDPHWYLNRSQFKSVYEHGSLIAKIERETGFRSKGKKGEIFIRHYYEKYDDPSLPASWMAAEVLSLGAWSQIYANLGKARDQKDIAKELDLPVDILSSWLQALTYLRNLCAHHSRVFNRNFTVKSKHGEKIPNELSTERFACFAAMLFYFLEKMSPDHHWHKKLKELLEKYPEIDLKELGFPENWSEDEFWGFENTTSEDLSS